MLENKKIVFEKPFDARFHTESFDDSVVPDGHILIKKKYSLISTGTELACIAGQEPWFKLPNVPGYSCVGEILKIGNGIEGFLPGDTVFSYGGHCLYENLPVIRRNNIVLKVPRELDLKWIPFTRMASVAATAVRVSNIEWGDCVAVTGQGLVGNMAMQLAALQGAKVIAIDMLDARLAVSKKCGADLVINSQKQNVKEEITHFTNGRMVNTLIEATGITDVSARAIEWIAQNGEMIFLGTPRAPYETNLTAFLRGIHLAASNITLKGAHEWKYPLMRTPFTKHSLARNTEIIFDLILRKKLELEALLTQISKPEDCHEIYDDLQKNKDRYMGIVFKWE